MFKFMTTTRYLRVVNYTTRKGRNVVLGGGLSGLSAAYYLTKHAPKAKVTLMEATERIGGWVRTWPATDNIIFEQGPRTIRPRGPPGANTLCLIEELGLAQEVKPILSSHPSARNRMLLIDGQLHSLPSSLSSAVKTIARRPHLLQPIFVHLWRDLRQETRPPPATTDESIYSFVERHMSRQAADYLISPLICGICAGDAREISVKFLLKPMFEGVQEHGSISKWIVKSALEKKSKNGNQTEIGSLEKQAKEEKWSVWSLNGGLETLPRTLNKKIQERNVNVLLNRPCTQLTFDEKGAKLTGANGEGCFHASHVISSLPTERLASIVKSQHPELSKELEAIPSVTVAVVNLAFKGDSILKHNAFGFLVPPREDKPILGVIFDSCSFPQEGHTVLTIMMGGRWFSDRFGDKPSESVLFDTAMKQVTEILGVNQKPICHKVSILRNCIPQYIVGHHDRVERIREYVRTNKLPLTLVGASYDGVGVNDVILSSKKGVDELLGL